MSIETPAVDEATEVIAVVDHSAPVFVDASGRRGRRIRIVFGMLGAATLVYGALVATSLAGGPLKPQQLLPFPDLVNNLPVLDPQPTAGPGAKNTPPPNKPAVASGKKINNGKVGPSGGASAAVPGAAGGPVVAATTPGVESTSAAPQPSASATKPPATPTPSAQATPTATPTSTQTLPGTTEGTAGTALPGLPGPGVPPHSAGAIPVGETSTGRPSATPLVGSSTSTVQADAGASAA